MVGKNHNDPQTVETDSRRPFGESREGFIVRDLLAFDRTMMANQRTFLAYIRTFIGMFGAGIAMIKVFEMTWVYTVGWVFMLLSPVILIYGIFDYIRTRKRIEKYLPDAK